MPFASHPVAMQTKAGAAPIRVVRAMIAIAKPAVAAIRLPRWVFPRLLSGGAARRKQATIDLIHASPYLLRDIGLGDGQVSGQNRHA